MKFATRSVILFLAFVIVFGNAASAYACKCKFPKSREEAVSRASKAFRGRVVSISDHATDKKLVAVSFEVEEWFKGGKGAMTQATAYAALSSNCAVEFTVGETYVVFADEPYPISICTGTREALTKETGNRIEQPKYFTD